VLQRDRVLDGPQVLQLALSQFSCEAIWGMLSPCNLGCKGRESDDGDQL